MRGPLRALGARLDAVIVTVAQSHAGLVIRGSFWGLFVSTECTLATQCVNARLGASPLRSMQNQVSLYQMVTDAWMWRILLPLWR